MGAFTRIPKNTFENLQLDAGMILLNFDPSSPAEPDDEDIVCATTGGINITCNATYEDMGADVDNCMNNSKELKKPSGWDCGFAFTSLGTSPESMKLALGAADVSGNKVTIRRDLKQTDFVDKIWWVGDRADGGCVAVCLKNALGNGISLQTSKNGKGQISVSLTGHVSIQQQEDMPMEFYSIDPVGAGVGG